MAFTAVGAAVGAAPSETLKPGRSGDAAKLLSRIEQEQVVGTAAITITEAE